MDSNGDGIIIIPTDLDAQPVNPAEAARSLCAQLDRTGDQISAAIKAAAGQISNPQRLAALSDQLDRLAQSIQAAADQTSEEPARTELDTVEAEAAALLELLDAEKRLDEPARDLPRQLENLPFPLDKVTRAITSNPAGRGSIDNASKAQRAQGIRLLTRLSLNFVGEAAKREIDRLTPFDRRALLTIGGLYMNGAHTVTLAQIYAKMGGGELKPEQREKLAQSIETLCCTRVTADNSEERAVNPDAPKIKLNFALLEARIGLVEYRGRTVDAVTVLALPQWLQLAELRGEITRIPFEAFTDGLRLTDQSSALSDYLLDRIAHMNNNPQHAETHIRIDTAAAKCGAQLNNRSEKQKFARKLETKLKHYAAIGHITSYKPYESGFVVIPKPKQRKG